MSQPKKETVTVRTLGAHLTVSHGQNHLAIEGSHWPVFVVLCAAAAIVPMLFNFTALFAGQTLIPTMVFWMVGLSILYLIPPTYAIYVDREQGTLFYGRNYLVFRNLKTFRLGEIIRIEVIDNEGVGAIALIGKNQCSQMISSGFSSTEALEIVKHLRVFLLN